jgi:hypothetical protein
MKTRKETRYTYFSDIDLLTLSSILDEESLLWETGERARLAIRIGKVKSLPTNECRKRNDAS